MDFTHSEIALATEWPRLSYDSTVATDELTYNATSPSDRMWLLLQGDKPKECWEERKKETARRAEVFRASAKQICFRGHNEKRAGCLGLKHKGVIQ